MNTKILLFYCSENQSVVSKFMQDLSSTGAVFEQVALDKTNTDIDALLTTSAPAIIFITDNFLKNEHCLYKAHLRLGPYIKNGRILVVVADGYVVNPDHSITAVPTQFARVTHVIQYLNYWQQRHLDYKKHNEANISEEYLGMLRTVSAEVADFATILRESNFQTIERMEQDNYVQFCLAAGLSTPNGFVSTNASTHIEPTIISPTAASQPEVIQEVTKETAGEPEKNQQLTVEPPQAQSEKEEDQLLDSIISDIPGLNLLKEVSSENDDSNNKSKAYNFLKEVDEDDFFEEKEEVIANSNVNQVMNEVVAEESDEYKLEKPQDAATDEVDILDIYEKDDTDEVDDLFHNITSSKAHINLEEQTSEIIEPENEVDNISIEEETTNLLQEETKSEAQVMDYEIDKPLESNIEVALDRIEHKDYSGAEAILQALISNSPNHPDANYLLGEIAEINHQYVAARTYYQIVAEHTPHFPRIFERLALLNAQHFDDDYKLTKKYYKAALAVDENNVDLLYAYADFLNSKLDDQPKAIEYFNNVIALNPEHPFAHYDLAVIYYQLGDIPMANEHYLAACENNPEFSTPENDEAFSNYKILDLDRAGEAINLHNIQEDDEILTPIEEREALSLTHIESSSIPQSAIVQKVEKINKFKPLPNKKIVLISGATAGIGKATATIFAKNGYNLILTGRREQRLIQIQNEFHEKYDVGCIILDFDIRNYENIKVIFDSLDKDWKNIDILINNAGLAIGMDPINEGDPMEWDAMIDTNIKGLLYLTRVISPQMVQRKSGHIINLCSTAGKEAYPNGNVYSATKFAVESLTKNMRIDLHKYGIRVGQVSPGAVEETEFSNVRFRGDAEKAEKVYDGFKPLLPEDVADAVFYMASAPAHVNIQDILLMGTQQASAVFIDRSGR